MSAQRTKEEVNALEMIKYLSTYAMRKGYEIQKYADGIGFKLSLRYKGRERDIEVRIDAPTLGRNVRGVVIWYYKIPSANKFLRRMESWDWGTDKKKEELVSKLNEVIESAKNNIDSELYLDKMRAEDERISRKLEELAKGLRLGGEEVPISVISEGGLVKMLFWLNEKQAEELLRKLK